MKKMGGKPTSEIFVGLSRISGEKSCFSTKEKSFTRANSHILFHTPKSLVASKRTTPWRTIRLDESPAGCYRLENRSIPNYAYVPSSFQWILCLKSNALPLKNICFRRLQKVVKQFSPSKKFQEFKKISFVGFNHILNDCMNLLCLSQNFCNSLPQLKSVS